MLWTCSERSDVKKGTKQQTIVNGYLAQALIRIEGYHGLPCTGFEVIPDKNQFILIKELHFPPSDLNHGIQRVTKILRKSCPTFPRRLYSRQCKRILHLAVCFGDGHDSCLFEIPLILLNELAVLKMNIEVFVSSE